MYAQLGGWIFAETIAGIAFASIWIVLAFELSNLFKSASMENENRTYPYINALAWKGYKTLSDCVKSHLNTCIGVFLVTNFTLIAIFGFIVLISSSVFWLLIVPAIYIGVTVYIYKNMRNNFWPMGGVFDFGEALLEDCKVKYKNGKVILYEFGKIAFDRANEYFHPVEQNDETGSTDEQTNSNSDDSSDSSDNKTETVDEQETATEHKEDN